MNAILPPRIEYRPVALSNARVALLQVSIWPTRRSMLEHISDHVGHLRVLISTASEPDRPWSLARGRLDVVTQKTISLISHWRSSLGHRSKQYVCFPIDSYFQLQRFRPDVVVSLELGFRTLMACIYRITHRGVPLIIWVCMTEEQQKGYRPFRRLLRKVLIRCADAIVANGSSAKRCMLELGYPEERIFIVPTVCDLGPFLSIRSVPPVVGVRHLVYVGQLIVRKGLLPFLARLDVFARNNPSLRIVFEVYGYGPLQKLILEATSSSNLTVLYMGSLSVDELPKAYSSADIFAFPTLSDEWGLVVNEAMASGVPVLGSRYSQAVEELVEDGSTGWLFAPDNVIELDGAIKRALQTPNEALLSMGQRARQAVRRVFPDRAADAMLHAINCVLGQNAP